MPNKLGVTRCTRNGGCHPRIKFTGRVRE
jgi:hypothetical protein